MSPYEEESAARSDKEPTAERPAIHLDQSDSSDEAVPGAALIHAGSESETPLPVAGPQATSELDQPAAILQSSEHRCYFLAFPWGKLV